MKCDHIREIKFLSEAIRDGFMTVLYDMSCMVWYSMFWYGTLGHRTVWFGIVWHDLVKYSIVWYGMVL